MYKLRLDLMFGICIGPIAATISDSNIEKVTATHSAFSGEEKKNHGSYSKLQYQNQTVKVVSTHP